MVLQHSQGFSGYVHNKQRTYVCLFYVHANIFCYIPNATCPQLLYYTRHASVELQQLFHSKVNLKVECLILDEQHCPQLFTYSSHMCRCLVLQLLGINQHIGTLRPTSTIGVHTIYLEIFAAPCSYFIVIHEKIYLQFTLLIFQHDSVV